MMTRLKTVAPLLTGLLLLGSTAAAQERLVLEPGVLELERIGEPGSTPALFGNAYFSPYESLDQRLIAVLNQAKPGTTVYMSYYSISYNEYPKTFKALKKRGVTVKLNLNEKDALAPHKKIDDDLIAHGFDVALIPNLRNPKGQGSLHTKFTVVETAKGPIVVTGSANLSASASLANHEHIVVVAGSASLAKQYVTEWNEQRKAAAVMHPALTEDEWSTYNQSWSDPFPDDWTEGGADSRARKLATALEAIDQPTSNSLTHVKAWFSPEDQLDTRIRPYLRGAKKTIKVAMYTFVNGLVNDLVYAADHGVEVTVIADGHQQQMEFAAWVNEKLENHPHIHYVRANNHLGKYSAIHHKYALVDDRIVLGGSYNWTGNATDYNDENLIVLDSPKIAARFAKDFAGMLEEYDPEGTHPAPPAVPGDTTRVLFAVEIPFSIKRSHQVVVDVTDAAGHTTQVELRHSRSTGLNWLGSADLPRGAKVSWRTRFGKRGGLAGGLSGEASEAFAEQEAHDLTTKASGLPQIVHGAWTGPDPTAN